MISKRPFSTVFWISFLVIQPFKLSASCIVSYFITHTDYLMWQDPQKQLTTCNCVCRRPAERSMRLRLRRRTSLTTHRTSTEQLSIKQTPEHTCTVRKLLLGSFPQTQALFNCIMTIMNIPSNSSLISECCSCEAVITTTAHQIHSVFTLN